MCLLFMGTSSLPHRLCRTPRRCFWSKSLEESNPLRGWFNTALAVDDIQTLSQGGCLDSALSRLEEVNTSVSDDVYISLLRACQRRKSLPHVKQVHKHLSHHIPNPTCVLIDHLIIALVKCGALEDALHVFQGCTLHSVYSWTALISGFTECGQAQEALELHQRMKGEGVEPNDYTYVILLKACGTIYCLQEGQNLHSEAQKKGLTSDVFLGSSLVSMYGKCGNLAEAENVFINLSQRNVVTWNGMLSVYGQEDQAEKALQLYRQMSEEGICANDMTFVVVLQACGVLADREEVSAIDSKPTKVVAFSIGQAFHAVARKVGLTTDIGNNLVSVYGKCLSVGEAENVFSALSELSLVAWNGMIAAYAEHGQGRLALQLYHHMHEVGVSPNEWTFVSALQACNTIAEEEDASLGGCIHIPLSMEIGQALHNDADRHDFSSHIFVANSILSMYRRSGNPKKAENMFLGLSRANLVSWNAMLSTYVEHGQEEMSLQLYRRMQEGYERANEQTFTIVIQACGNLAEKEHINGVADSKQAKLVALEVGQALHADFLRSCTMSSAFVGNTLVSIYGKCGRITESEHAFQDIPLYNVVSWNAMISAYVENKKGEKALQLFHQMLQEGVRASKLTFKAVLQASGLLADENDGILGKGPSWSKMVSLEIIRALHADAERAGYDKDVSVASTLINAYNRCEEVPQASCVFEKMPQKNVMSWNVMLATYVEHGLNEKALELYRQMREVCSAADDITLVYILQACSDLGQIEMCHDLHFSAVSAAHDVNLLVSTTLIHAYGNCTTMMDAETVFDHMDQPDVVSWSAGLAGHARDGNHMASLQLLQEMIRTAVEPNRVTILALLQACSHAGLVYEGVEYFGSMQFDLGIRPDVKCYAGIIDLLGRAGDFSKVEDLLWRLPMQDDLTIWLCILSVCYIHGNVDLGVYAFDHAMSLEWEESTSYVMMANIYAVDGLLDSARSM